MIVEMNLEESLRVAGGNIIQELEDRFPGGEWVGNSFFPNGAPKPPYTGPVIW